MKINKRNLYHWLLLTQQAIYTLVIVMVRTLSRTRDSSVILYGHQLSGNLRALYNAQRARQGSAISLRYLTLDPAQVKALEAEHVDVLACYRLRDMIKLARCRVIVTDHGLHALKPLLFLSDITFVDVWHGLPFKGFPAAAFSTQHRYDEVWVTSEYLKTLYINKFGFSPEKLVCMGYARTDALFAARGDTAGSTREEPTQPAEQRMVLYAPTWQQDDSTRSIFPFNCDSGEFLDRLGKLCLDHNATFAVRTHLNTQSSGDNHAGVVYLPMKDYPHTEPLLAQSIVLVCDWSSLAFDFLALERPAIFLDVPPPFKDGFSLDKAFRFGHIAADFDDLCQTLGQLLQDDSAYWQQHREAHHTCIATLYGDNADGYCTQRQLARLETLAHG